MFLRVLRDTRIFYTKNCLFQRSFLFLSYLQRTSRVCSMKKMKTEQEKITIGTHNGCFHCDEVLACFMLKQLPAYKNAEIIRTRDKDILDTCDIVVDVGGEFDTNRQRYDHHQREFNETMHSLNPVFPWEIKLSSAGLIYYHYGHNIIKAMLKDCDEDCINATFKQVYEYFIQEIDAIDNGVPMFESEPLYRITTNLSSRVANLNPPWNSSNKDETEGFYKALKLVGDEFTDRVIHKATVWWPARSLVSNALNNRYQVHVSGEIMVFDEENFCPWKEHLFVLENENQIIPKIKFVIFFSNDTWRVQGVPVNVGSYICRVFLCKDWFGLRDDELVKVSGIDGSVFVHSTGFIGGNKTKDGALEMAIQSLLKHRDLHGSSVST